MSTNLTNPVFDYNKYFALPGEKGMTSTSANKLANLAKERNREDMMFVANIKFFSNEMTLLVNPAEKVVLSRGLDGSSEEFQKIKEALMRTARFNAIISWIREAIQAKAALIFQVKTTQIEEWCEQNGIEYPKKPVDNIEREKRKNSASSKAGEEEMARYFIDEAKAAVLGQAIHPDGAVDIARRTLIEATLNPSTIEGTGKDTTITTKVPTAATEAVTDFYMALQSDWRHAEAAVNEAKSNWQLADDELELELTNELNAKTREYQNKLSRIVSDWEKWKLEETRRIGKLKIKIPALLQPVLDELLALGKEKVQ